MTVPLNIPFVHGEEIKQLRTLLEGQNNTSNVLLCENALKQLTGADEVLLTTNCTHAMEMMALLLDFEIGDELIMSSFNFVSAANAFVLRGATIKFVDIDPKTMNIDPNLIEAAITEKTKAILVMHYGGVACDMDQIKVIADKHNLFILEDAAHSIGSYYHDQHLGTIGDFGALSFHHTKNIQCGEGGALIINSPKYAEKARHIRDKGTNRGDFMAGLVDKYSWVSLGSSYVLSEYLAAILLVQLRALSYVNKARKAIWNEYYDSLSPLTKTSSGKEHNAHIFYIICNNELERLELRNMLAKDGIETAHHYIPLHSSIAGKLYGTFCGHDVYTTTLSERILRLPIYPTMNSSDLIIDRVSSYFEK